MQRPIGGAKSKYPMSGSTAPERCPVPGSRQSEDGWLEYLLNHSNTVHTHHGRQSIYPKGLRKAHHWHPENRAAASRGAGCRPAASVTERHPGKAATPICPPALRWLAFCHLEGKEAC